MIDRERRWPLLVLGGAAFILASAASLAGYVAFPISVLAAGCAASFVMSPRGRVRWIHYAVFVLLLAIALSASVGLTRAWTH